MLRFWRTIVVAVALFSSGTKAQEENSLTRDEVAVIKRKLVAILDALGQPPAGYVKEDEDFNLPTEFYEAESRGLFQALNSSASRKFGGGSDTKAKQADKDLQMEYEKKIAEAQAKGDYEALARISQEMSKKQGEARLQVIESTKEPINVSIQLNSNPGTTIDPDAVLFESPGVIALKLESQEGESKTRVGVYFDPVSLKNTKKLSRVEMREARDGVDNKTTVLNATVELNGPAAEVEKWAKKIDTRKVLAQIDARSRQ